MASIKDIDLGVCSRGCAHLSQLTTNTIIPFFQVLDRSFLSETKGRFYGMTLRLLLKKKTLLHRQSNYPILLVVIAIMNDDKTQIETLAQVKQVVSLSFSPAIVMEMHLILLF